MLKKLSCFRGSVAAITAEPSNAFYVKKLSCFRGSVAAVTAEPSNAFNVKSCPTYAECSRSES